MPIVTAAHSPLSDPCCPLPLPLYLLPWRVEDWGSGGDEVDAGAGIRAVDCPDMVSQITTPTEMR
jgi:hypothetical protein